MKWTSIVAIYFLFWAMCVFLVLPFGVRTPEEAGEEKVPGQMDGSPHQFLVGRFVLRTTILSAVLVGLYYLNYVNGWISVQDINLLDRH